MIFIHSRRDCGTNDKLKKNKIPKTVGVYFSTITRGKTRFHYVGEWKKKKKHWPFIREIKFL